MRERERGFFVMLGANRAQNCKVLGMRKTKILDNRAVSWHQRCSDACMIKGWGGGYESIFPQGGGGEGIVWGFIFQPLNLFRKRVLKLLYIQ